MHSQEQIQLLLENPIVQELLEILENEGKAVLQHLEFSYINQLFEQRKKTKKGRKRKPKSLFEFSIPTIKPPVLKI